MIDYVGIRAVTEKDPISQAIRDVTWSAFSHVEFYLLEPLTLPNGAVIPAGWTIGAHAAGGVKPRPGNYAVFTNEERYRIPVTPEQKTAILAYAAQQIGKPYDFADIAGILLHRDWRAEDTWICSELLAASFEKGGKPLLHAPAGKVNRITPRDVYLSPYLDGNRIWPI